MSLLNLYGEFPILDSSGHENFASLETQSHIQTMLEKTHFPRAELIKVFESPLEEYRDNPEQQEQILTWMRDARYLQARRRDLFALLNLRVSVGVTRETLDRYVRVFGNTLVKELSDMRP